MSLKTKLLELVEAEATAKKWKEKVSDLKREIEEDMMTNELDSLKTDSGLGCVLDKPKLYASFSKEHTVEVEDWCITLGIGDIFKRSVNSQTFSANVRQLVEEGVELHPLINTHTKRTLKITGRTQNV